MNARHLLALSALTLAPGCAALQNFQVPQSAAEPPPTLSFEAENVSNRSLAASTLELVYVVHNPGSTAVSVSGVHYALSVENHAAFDGSPQQTVSVPPNGTAELRLSAPVTFAEVPMSADVTQAHYDGQGTVDVQTGSGVVSLPFDHAGTLVVPQKPTFTVSIPKLTGVAFPSASLAVPVKVRNPNDFPITLTHLSGDVSVLGSAIGHVTNAAQREIAPGQEETTELSVEVPYLTLAAAALAKKVPEVGFQGLLETGPVQVPLSFTQAIPLSLQAPKVSLGVPRIEHVGFTSATLVFPFDVQNPNALPLPLGALDGALDVSGNSVGQIATKDLGLVPAGQLAHVEVPMTVQLLGTARSVLADGPVSVGFHGRVRAASAELPLDFTQQLSIQH